MLSIWVDNFLEFLAPGWVGSLIGMLGIAAALLTYIFTRQRKSLSYTHSGERLLGTSRGSLPSEITVQYQGTDIPRLTRSLVYLWNSGEQTILRGQCATSDPCAILIGNDGQILSTTILNTTRFAIDFEISENTDRPHCAYFNFEFLDSNDGAAIEILHTSSKTSVLLTGTVQGMPRGIKNLGSSQSFTVKLPFAFSGSPKVFAWAATVVGAGIVPGSFFLPTSILDAFATTGGRVAALTVGAVYCLAGVVGIYFFRRKHPKGLKPTERD